MNNKHHKTIEQPEQPPMAFQSRNTNFDKTEPIKLALNVAPPASGHVRQSMDAALL